MKYFSLVFFLAEDSSETTVARISEAQARAVCRDRCDDNQDNMFYAVRLISQGQFKCKCLTNSLTALVAGYEGFSRSPVQDVPCPDYTDPIKTDLHADTDLRGFLNESTVGLWTKLAGQDNATDQRVNICNLERETDIITLYLASALGLSVTNIVTNFVYDGSKNYTFPNHTTQGPDTIYPPYQLAAFPNLEQSYWTVMAQLTTATEPGLRTAERSPKWCWYQALLSQYSKLQIVLFSIHIGSFLDAIAECIWYTSISFRPYVAGYVLPTNQIA